MMDGRQELRDALSILRWHAEQKLSLDKKETNDLLMRVMAAEIAGWRHLAIGDGNTEELFATLARLTIHLGRHRKKDGKGAPAKTFALAGDLWVIEQYEARAGAAKITELVREAVTAGKLRPDQKDDVHAKRIERLRAKMASQEIARK